MMPLATVREARADAEAGFTLVELLVALALFSLLTMLLFNSVSFGVQAWRSGSARADELQRGVAAEGVLRRLLGNVYPMISSQSDPQPRVDFDGAREAVEFLSDAPIVSGAAGRFRFRLFVDRKPDRADLALQATPELASGQEVSGTRTLLLSDIDHAEFAYGGAATPAGTTQWSDSWQKRSDIPGLIRLRVSFRSGDGRAWPDLLIAPRVRADVGCVYDSITMRCRGR
jgi:general secretion pathway protein J